MRIAVLCFAHKDPELLNVQIAQFTENSDDVDFYIHLDAKSLWMKDSIKKGEHVFFVSNPVSVTWGDDSMMKALFNSWEDIRSKNRLYDYFIMTTGQDLIVKSGLKKYLSANRGKIWIDAEEQDSIRKQVLAHKFPKVFCRDLSKHSCLPLRILRSIYFRLLKFHGIPKRNLNFDLSSLKFYYSFNWSVMPYNVFEYCLDYISNNPDFKQIYLNTILPEDSFLGTLIMNSPYKDNVVLLSTRKTATQTFHYPFSVHPRVLSMIDIHEIESSNCYFARKFDSKVDFEVIEYFRDKIINN